MLREYIGVMAKSFNINGACRPDKHYMVDISPRLAKIREMVDAGAYFTINRARQYGKTTTLRALAGYLADDYVIVSLDFQRMSYSDFENEPAFVQGLAREIGRRIRAMGNVPETIKDDLRKIADRSRPGVRMAELFDIFDEWCGQSEKPVVLIVDEADTATNNQIFLDFLAQLRAAYLDSDETPTFGSVILAGVYDVRNIRRKLRPEEEHRENSPWNIASDFRVDMSFSVSDIAGMLAEYEAGHHLGMDVMQMSELLYDYTSGYPYLVSWLCKCMDEYLVEEELFSDRHAAWTKTGFLEAVKMLLEDDNPLFESLMDKLKTFPELTRVISRLLFQGQRIAYNPDDRAVQNAQMFGFVKIRHASVLIANRIFETRLYNWFLLDYREQNSEIFAESSRQKNQFITGGYLNVRLVLEKFVETFHYLYGEREEAFLEGGNSMLGNCMDKVRAAAPLVHNITNYVTVNDVANILLACGGSPIMSDEPEDVEDITAICSGLNINIGTLNQRSIEAMFRAGKKADSLGHTLLLDPVGAGASALRTNTSVKLMEELTFDAIRGNISEIKTLAAGSGTTRGVDADVADAVTEENLDGAVGFVKNFAQKAGCIAAVTGAIDLVSDGKVCYVIRNGRPEMGRITGTGCQLSGMMTAFLAANPEEKTAAAAAAVCAMGLAGEIAWEHMQEGDGNAAYRNRIIDAICHMDGSILEKGARYEVR